VQPQIDQAVESARLATRRMNLRVGQHTTDLPGLQQGVGRRLEPAGMARLQRNRAGMALAQFAQKIIHGDRIKRQAGRQLHQQAAQLAAQAVGLRQEGIEQRRAVPQPLLVRDGFGQLDRKAEVVRNACGPARIGRALVRAIERGIDFGGVQPRRIALKVRAVSRRSRP